MDSWLARYTHSMRERFQTHLRLSVSLVGIALAVACEASPRALARPNYVDVDDAGRVYVSDLHHNRVLRFDADGSYLGEIGVRGVGRGKLWRVMALAVDADGSLLVVDHLPNGGARYDHAYMVVKRFRGGREVESFPILGPDGEPLGFVEALQPLPGGGYVAANIDGGTTYRYDEQFAFQGVFERASGMAHALAVDGELVWALDQYHHSWRAINDAGLGERDFERGGRGADAVWFPTALDVCPGQWLAIADLGNHRVQRYGLDGSYLGGGAPADVSDDRPTQLLDVAITPDCSSMWLVDGKGDRLLQMGLDGEVLQSIASW